MACPKCSRLRKLFSEAIGKHAELRAKDVAVLESGDQIAAQAMEGKLELSTADIHTLRMQLLDHEAAHNGNRHVRPGHESQSSEA
jgi:hypothetical protein